MFFSITKLNSNYERLLIRLLFVFGVLLFKIILDEYYVIYGPLFTYLGLKFQPQVENVQILNYLVTLFTAVVLPLNYKKPSNVFLLLLYIMSYIPITVLHAFDITASSYAFLFYTLFIVCLSLLDKIRFPSIEFSDYSLSKKGFRRLLFILITITLTILISHYGINFNVKNYSDIYDVRSAFKDATQQNRLLVFSFNWTANVFSIFLLAIGVVRKKWGLGVLAFVIQFYLFNLGGNKSIFMLPIFIIFVIFTIKDLKKLSLLAILYSFVFMAIGLYVFDFVINDHFSMLSSIFIRRNFYVPANIFYYYFEFFQYNPHDYFAQSFPFSYVLDSYYDFDIPILIGKEFIREGTHANGNFLADLYYNLSWFGFGLGLIVVFIYFRIIDFFAMHKNLLVVVPLSTVPVISLMNSGLIVNLVSFGLIFILLLLFLYPKEKKYFLKK